MVIQAFLMTMYMIMGFRAYSKVITGWCRQKTLFMIEIGIIAYLIVNEFNHRHINGMFFILLFAQWTLFVTFNIVVDSMMTNE